MHSALCLLPACGEKVAEGRMRGGRRNNNHNKPIISKPIINLKPHRIVANTHIAIILLAQQADANSAEEAKRATNVRHRTDFRTRVRASCGT